MLKKIFQRVTPTFAGPPLSAAERLQFSTFPTVEMAARLLTAPSALMQLSLADARVVVRYMRPRYIAQGTTFIREGDEHNTDFMALILEGDVVVESVVFSRVEPIIMTVLGPGSMHGEMSLLDGLPRSVSCVASTDLSCAILTRQAMLQLLADDPRTGAKLVMAIAMRIGDRLRDNTGKLKKFVQLNRLLQQELNRPDGS